jgi:hypothetical protein
MHAHLGVHHVPSHSLLAKTLLVMNTALLHAHLGVHHVPSHSLLAKTLLVMNREASTRQ